MCRGGRSLDPRNPGRSAPGGTLAHSFTRSLAHSFTHSSRKPEVAVKNFPVDVWWPVYEARTAHFAVFGVSGVVHQRVYRGLGHDGMSSQRCWTRERGEAREGGGGGRGAGGCGDTGQDEGNAGVSEAERSER